MRKVVLLASPLTAALCLALPAHAATWYVSPTGAAASGCTSRDTPCSLTAAGSGAMAGDTVILMDGVYKTGLQITNSGTSSAWITFKADECSTPIIEGPGVGPAEDNQDSGVYSATATYVRFDGIVSRGWSTGFGNGWTGNKVQDSNGNWDIENCIADMNGRTGFTFFSAQNFTLKHSIAAHSGSSTVHSWSSGVTLYSSLGGVITANVSFENMDAQKHTDGSGFIADQGSDGTVFANNLAFLNGGSCLRLTSSKSVEFVNNTCYHDAQDALDDGPSDPDEVYFTNAPSDTSTITSISFLNNVLVALGSGPGMKASNYTPTSGWTNNVTATGTVTYFTGADGSPPDFTIAGGASALIGKGTTGMGVPTDDLGFDPKCLVKKAPTMIGAMAAGSWWQTSIDYDYIKSIGGVAQCFHPKARSGTPDAGAYANGAVMTATANTCTPPTTGSGGMGAGGTTSNGGMPAAGGGTAGSGVSAGGTGNVGAGGVSAGGMTAAGGIGTGGSGTGGSGTGGSSPPNAGTTSTTGGTANGAGGSGGSATSGTAGVATGGTTSGDGGSAGATDKAASGCSCRTAGDATNGAELGGFALFGLACASFRRRRTLR